MRFKRSQMWRPWCSPSTICMVSWRYSPVPAFVGLISESVMITVYQPAGTGSNESSGSWSAALKPLRLTGIVALPSSGCGGLGLRGLCDRRLEVVPGQRALGGEAVPIPRDTCRVLTHVQHASIERDRAIVGLLESEVILPDRLLERGVADYIGPLLHDVCGPAVQLERCVVVGLAIGRLHLPDLVMRDDEHGNPPLITEVVEWVQELAPVHEGLDVALAAADLLDVLHRVSLCDVRPDQRLGPVERVEYDGLELVLLGRECRERAHDDVEGLGQRKLGDGEGVKALLGLDEDRIGRAGREGRLPDLRSAVDDDLWCAER